jgi:hypothetical protein
VVALYSKPPYVRNRLTFGTALCSALRGNIHYSRNVTPWSITPVCTYHSLILKGPLCLSSGRSGCTCRQMRRPEWWAERKHGDKPQNVRSLHIAIWATGRRPGQRSRFSDSLRAAWSGNRILVAARFSALVHTGPVVRPASCMTGTGFLPRGKVAGAWHWPPTHPPTSCAEVKKSRPLPLLPLCALMTCYRVYFTFTGL